MSPEQCRGTGEITGKSDVYSLGVMLYEMVGGRPLMTAEAAAGELIAMHIYLVPTPLREVDPGLPADLTQLVDTMLAKNPDDRPAMTAVVKQLEQLAASRSMPPSAGSLPLPAGADKTPAVSPSWPEVVAGMLATPTTLRAAAAKAPLEPPAARRGVNPLWVVAVGALGVAAVASLQWVRRPASEPATRASAPLPGKPTDGVAATEHAPAAAGSTVHWQVTSQPPGAQVVRVSDQQILGNTPWQSELPAGPQKLLLVLRLSGFADKNVELSQSISGDRSEALLPTAPASAPALRNRSHRHGSSRTLPAGKSTSEEISDDELRIVK